MDFTKAVISDFIAVLIDCLALVLALLLPLLVVIFLLTFPLDLIVWLTGNEDSWPHTGFAAPILAALSIAFARAFVWVGDVALGFACRKFPWLDTKHEVRFTPREGTRAYYAWANRLSPHDK
jgi:hypothetical protein